MAIFRKGVKVGKYDVRIGVSKKRAQAFLRKHKLLEDGKGRKEFEKDAKGEVQTIRTVVGKGEGFQIPANFKVEFQMPRGIQQASLGEDDSGNMSYSGTNASLVKSGGLDWRTHIMNKSTDREFRGLWFAAQESSGMMWKKATNQKYLRSEQKMDLYCSKVAIPDKSFNPAAIRQYNHPQFMPQSIMYGTLTTEFYCDGTMDIKNYFDAWQKLIYNDMTGNFNYYDEYTAEFDVHTRTTIAQPPAQPSRNPHAVPEKSRAEKISQGIKDFTSDIDKATGVDGPRGKGQGAGTKPLPHIDFRENYGVRVFSCFPQIVGELSLAHDATDSILTFDVTWSYVKWNPFKMGNIGNRSTINLSVGEFRNEKDGFPFLEDLPPELSGPLTGAVNQGITTGPLSKASNFLG